MVTWVTSATLVGLCGIPFGRMIFDDVPDAVRGAHPE